MTIKSMVTQVLSSCSSFDSLGKNDNWMIILRHEFTHEQKFSAYSDMNFDDRSNFMYGSQGCIAVIARDNSIVSI